MQWHLALSSWALYDSAMNRRRGDYGYDAPPALIGIVSIAILATILAVASWMTPEHRGFPRAVGYAVIFGLEAAWFCYGTRRGKFHMWEYILDGLKLQGSEHVLDMGCGRGAVLTAVARRLTTGRVTGVDLWRSIDQSGNSANATMANARAEGVADRVAVETGDMRRLPFADNTFDVIVSSLAIHNISGNAGRAAAVAESRTTQFNPTKAQHLIAWTRGAAACASSRFEGARATRGRSAGIQSSPRWRGLAPRYGCASGRCWRR